MPSLEISKPSKKFLKKLPKKQQQQVTRKIWSLKQEPFPNDSRKLEGFKEFFRVDIGEYRIIYRLDGELLTVSLVGKRNDDDVYRRFKRLI